jgi:hypothetical protein
MTSAIVDFRGAQAARLLAMAARHREFFSQ